MLRPQCSYTLTCVNADTNLGPPAFDKSEFKRCPESLPNSEMLLTCINVPITFSSLGKGKMWLSNLNRLKLFRNRLSSHEIYSL